MPSTVSDLQLVKSGPVEAHTVAFWGDRLDVAPKTIYRAIERGDLRCYRIGRAVRITEEQISSYLEGSVSGE